MYIFTCDTWLEGWRKFASQTSKQSRFYSFIINENNVEDGVQWKRAFFVINEWTEIHLAFKTISYILNLSLYQILLVCLYINTCTTTIYRKVVFFLFLLGCYEVGKRCVGSVPEHIISVIINLRHNRLLLNYIGKILRPLKKLTSVSFICQFKRRKMAV